MANINMNLGDKLIFDANDTTAGTTYLTCPATAVAPQNRIEAHVNSAKQLELNSSNLVHTPTSRPEVRLGTADGGGGTDQYRIWLPAAKRRLLVFGDSASPWMLSEARIQAESIKLQGTVEALKQGSAGGKFVAEEGYSYATPQNRSLIVMPDVFSNSKRSEETLSDCWWYNGPGNFGEIQFYLRAADLTHVHARATIPLSLPHGATLNAWTVQYRRLAPTSGLRRAFMWLIQWPKWGTTSSPGNLGSLEVDEADGSNLNGTKSHAMSGVVDTEQYGYSIQVDFTNSSTTNGGADGMGIFAFKIDYSISQLR